MGRIAGCTSIFSCAVNFWKRLKSNLESESATPLSFVGTNFANTRTLCWSIVRTKYQSRYIQFLQLEAVEFTMLSMDSLSQKIMIH